MNLKWNSTWSEIWNICFLCTVGWFRQTIISCWHRFDHWPHHGQKEKETFISCWQFIWVYYPFTSLYVTWNLEMEMTMKQQRRNLIWHRWKMAVVSFSRWVGCYRAAEKYWARFFHPIGDDLTKSLIVDVLRTNLHVFPFICWWSLSWPDVILLSWANICSVTK